MNIMSALSNIDLSSHPSYILLYYLIQTLIILLLFKFSSLNISKNLKKAFSSAAWAMLIAWIGVHLLLPILYFLSGMGFLSGITPGPLKIYKTYVPDYIRSTIMFFQLYFGIVIFFLVWSTLTIRDWLKSKSPEGSPSPSPLTFGLAVLMILCLFLGSAFLLFKQNPNVELIKNIYKYQSIILSENTSSIEIQQLFDEVWNTASVELKIEFGHWFASNKKLRPEQYQKIYQIAMSLNPGYAQIGLLSRLSENEAIPKELQQQILQNAFPAMFNKILALPNQKQRGEFLSQLAILKKLPSTILKNILEILEKEDSTQFSFVIINVISRKTLTEEMAKEYIAKIPFCLTKERVYQELISYRTFPKEVIGEIAKQEPDLGFRYRLFKYLNPQMELPPEIKSKNYQEILGNPNTAPNVLHEILQETIKQLGNDLSLYPLVEIAAKNPNLSNEDLETLSVFPSCKLRQEIAKNPKTPNAILDKMQADPDKEIKENIRTLLKNQSGQKSSLP